MDSVPLWGRRMLFRRQVLAVTLMLIAVSVLTVAIYWYSNLRSLKKPAWLELGSFMVYEQAIAWADHQQVENMTWVVTKLEDDTANVHLISHGVDTSSGNVVITAGEANWTINAISREILNSSDHNYDGEKNPFWIEKNVGVGSSVDILYGMNTISSDESISVLGMQRDCWVVEYNWWSTSAMKRWYDKSSGIVLKIQVVLYRQDIRVEITETAIQTNIDFQP
ncbi:MAG: hypothetical protein NWE85_01605 [Candidatus Bathyarchaeota archaeon]|nr:hypothetical protein [Candidatus Bathyarchaeota archaeon]